MNAAPTFEACYDFTPIENAVQTLAGRSAFVVAWLTASDAIAFQKSRPRVECYLTPGQPFGSPPHYHNTDDGKRRINGWQGSLRTMIITPTIGGQAAPDAPADAQEAAAGQASYDLHWQYRSFVMALLAGLDTDLRDDADLLPYHQVARCWGAGDDPKIAPQTGVYTSQLSHNLIYSIRPTAWPGGITNAGKQ